MSKTKLYDKLGVSPDATADQIKKAYRKKAKENHPDIHPDKTEDFKEISLAYRVLSDPSMRRKYDQTGDESGTTVQLETEAMSIFLQELSKLIAEQQEGVLKKKLFSLAIEKINVEGRKRCRQIKMIKKQASLVDQIVSRITHKKGDQSLVAVSLRSQKNTMLSEIPKLKTEIRIYQRARRMAREYEFRNDMEVYTGNPWARSDMAFKIFMDPTA